MKSRPINLEGKSLTKNVGRWIQFLNRNFDSVYNCIKHLYCHQDSKEEVLQFVNELFAMEEIKENTFSSGIDHVAIGRYF